MGWTAGQLTGPATALNLIEFELGAEFCSRVITTHKKGGVVYAAVRHHTDDKVFALVLLVERRDGVVFTKAMTDPEGLCYYDCPASILDLLTPTDDEYANRWRQRCRDRAAHPKPRKGQQVRFAQTISFTDGTSCATFTFLGRTRFAAEDGAHVAIPRWTDLAYELIEPLPASGPAEPDICDECEIDYPTDALTLQGPWHTPACSLYVEFAEAGSR
jgi:hypothetical protein